jgi:peptidyl-prolyl cis-trans isomerase SurA
MKIRIFLLLVGFLIYGTYAQQDKSPLLIINGEEIGSEQFLRIYQKNLSLIDDNDKSGLDEYLNTFINYKLKVAEARRQGFDQKDAYKKELEGYRLQLVKNYMTDNQASEKLLNEAYERLQYEVSAIHILVRVAPEAAPVDTLYAYKQIHKIYKQATPSNFDSLRKAVHNSKDILGEDLGYFSVFRMVYPFENMAYNTLPGAISKPFRTRFGYHFLKVNDKRKNRGETEVAHIMISTSNNPEQKIQAKKRIQDIHHRLKRGGAFEELAKQFSEDKGSAILGGKLPKFGAGRLSSKIFEDKAFSIGAGAISEPFETRFGWHIIKGINQYPIGSFEDEKAKLETLLKKDQRSKIVSSSFLTKLKNRYAYKVNYEVRDAIIAMVDDDFYKRQWVYDKTNPILQEEVLSLRDSVWKAEKFASWLRQAQFRLRKDFGRINFEDLFNDFSEATLLKYHEDKLEDENKEFASILNEYREGLLLFDIMQEEVWDAARTDSTALREFYKQNKKNYFWKKRYNLVIASYTNPDITENLKTLMDKNPNSETFGKLTKGMPGLKEVIVTTPILEEGDYRLPKKYKPSKKWFKEKTASGLQLIKTMQVFKPQAKSFEEAKGEIMNDYQEFLEKEWINTLRDRYKVRINKKQLKKLKKSLKA